MDLVKVTSGGGDEGDIRANTDIACKLARTGIQ